MKVDWRRRTLRTFSSKGKTMVLGGRSPRRGRGQGQGLPVSCSDCKQGPRREVVREQGGQTQKVQSGVEVISCLEEQSDEPQKSVPLILAPSLRILLPRIKRFSHQFSRV